MRAGRSVALRSIVVVGGFVAVMVVLALQQDPAASLRRPDEGGAPMLVSAEREDTLSRARRFRSSEHHEAAGEASALVDWLADELQAALEQERMYVAYRRCVDERGDHAACRAKLSTALYGAMARVVEPFISAHVERLRASWPTRTEHIKHVLGALIAETREPTRALVAISVLQLLRPDDAFPLPLEAYRDLTQRTDPELQLILNGHVVHELPHASVRQAVEDIALSDALEPKLRLAAINALGHPSARAELDHLTQVVLEGRAGPVLLETDALPSALARCGSPCASLLEALAAHSSPHARRLAYRALGRVSDELAEVWRRQLVIAAPDTDDLVRR